MQRQYGLGPADARQSDVYLSRIVAAPQMAEPGFWIPLVDVDASNGCLSLLPGGHHHTAVYDSQWRSGDFVPELDGLKPAPMPMQVGDALLIHQHLPHVSPPNRSKGVRWSVDIRFQDGRLRVKSVREPGFLARSKERPRRRSDHPRGICAHSDGGKGLRPGDGNQLLSIAWTTTPRGN